MGVVKWESGRRQYVPKWLSVNSLKKESVLKSIFLRKVALWIQTQLLIFFLHWISKTMQNQLFFVVWRCLQKKTARNSKSSIILLSRSLLMFSMVSSFIWYSSQVSSSVSSPASPVNNICKYTKIRGLQRDVVYLCWPYESPSEGIGHRGVAGSQPMSTAVHITWQEAQNKLWRSTSTFNLWQKFTKSQKQGDTNRREKPPLFTKVKNTLYRIMTIVSFL